MSHCPSRTVPLGVARLWELTAGWAMLACAIVPAAICAAADPATSRDFYRPYHGAGEKTVAYQVKPGETLFDIAERLMGDPDQAAGLARRNGIDDPLHPVPGTTIQVPAPRLEIRYSIHKLVNGRELAVVEKGEELKAGDRFQIWLAANTDGYLYIFNRNAGDEIRRVFPAGARKTAHVRRFSEYLLPRTASPAAWTAPHTGMATGP